jgi:hypothetical protein
VRTSRGNTIGSPPHMVEMIFAAPNSKAGGWQKIIWASSGATRNPEGSAPRKRRLASVSFPILFLFGFLSHFNAVKKETQSRSGAYKYKRKANIIYLNICGKRS